MNHKDVFGNTLRAGHFILVSRGERSYKNFDKGIVTEIYTRKDKTQWLSFELHSTLKVKLDPSGISRNIVIIQNIREMQDTDLITDIKNAATLLVKEGKFSDNYKLGDPDSLITQNILDQEDCSYMDKYADLVDSMGIPESLRKYIRK